MKTETTDKLHLCFKEIAMCRQLLDTRRADDVCGRMLGIYIMMRADDITKIWSHEIPKGDIERLLADDVKAAYNDRFRRVRDKLGAHYQVPGDKATVDIFASSSLFRSFDHNDVSSLADELTAAESLIEGRELTFKGFDDPHDFSLALGAIDKLFADDRAYITNSALEVFGVNKGGLITCTPAQRKAQYLRGIELMAGYARHLATRPYNNADCARMFRRLLVCVIYNYHDNLYTRRELSRDAEQYEEGFDSLHKTLRSDRARLPEDTFEQFEEKYHTDDFFKRNRNIRDRACGHFDEKSDVRAINAIVDSADTGAMLEQYDNMLKLFNYACNNILSLKPMSLPPRSPLPGSRMVIPDGITNFYGEKPADEPLPEPMDPAEILKSIRKRDARHDEAAAQLRECLRTDDNARYLRMAVAIHDRLRQLKNPGPELQEIVMALRHAEGGYPTRLQRSILGMLSDHRIGRHIKLGLLWCLSHICRKDDEADVLSIIRRLASTGPGPVKCLAFNAYLHYLMDHEGPCPVDRIKARKVDADFAKLLQAIDEPKLAVGIRLALNQHWTIDQAYAIDRPVETEYDTFLKEGLRHSIQDYYRFAKINNDEERKLWDAYEQTGHHILLLLRLAQAEKRRNQRRNVFLDLWRCDCFTRTRTDMYESLGVGLMEELNGNLEMAHSILKTTVTDHPIEDDAINTLKEFEERNNMTL